MLDDRFSFSVVTGAVVDRVLRRDLGATVPWVSDAYLAHAAGECTNPPSQFLRFPDRPEARIIALPADVQADVQTSGIKWIASYPGNLARGLPRASAVLVLNRRDTGYPFAVMEASLISAARTAASATIGAEQLGPPGRRAAAIGFLGCGLIARYILDVMFARGWQFGFVGAHDVRGEQADAFLRHAAVGHAGGTWRASTPEELIRRSDLVVFATTSSEPYITDPRIFAHRPLVLHISLRDLAPEIILGANNIVDDVEHCLKAGTSVHLTEQRTGQRSFIHGTIAQVLRGEIALDRDNPTIYSPFGMGMLDVVVGKHVYDEAQEAGELIEIADFFTAGRAGERRLV
ncbi:2,3-diaminopropionate biosynthesis protein SbnB [Polyangium fumosum]|uniref:2,3-diaminopropionate biosynthesis protein SbnB n=1 Tax=Polyangium fumosum TaxID=889272 RepID=A0A4U1JEE5_9BACT|nr:2,3-diaminopropionate biosynthesis protein SbnB [Polyangium fumosum]TKD09432.1 2,3-diaminopropionate biosynthesis protein SbnB [Polyangium fumosum]